MKTQTIDCEGPLNVDCIDKAQGNSTSEKPCQTKLLLVNNCQKPKNEKENGFFFWVKILSIFNTHKKKIYRVYSKGSKKRIILYCIGGTSPCVKFRIITLTC